jgi:hypothetical protein
MNSGAADHEAASSAVRGRQRLGVLQRVIFEADGPRGVFAAAERQLTGIAQGRHLVHIYVLPVPEILAHSADLLALPRHYSAGATGKLPNDLPF